LIVRRVGEHVSLRTKGGYDWAERYPRIARSVLKLRVESVALDGEGDGPAIFEAACQLGLEGIVSKRADSAYKAGPSKMWLKTKNRNHPALVRVAESFDRHGR